jgi:hypothetical protein
MTDDETAKIAGRIEEYKALESEIDRRSTTQPVIGGVQLTSAAAIAGLAGAHPNLIAVLLLIPPLSMFLLIEWLDHHLQIRDESQYIAFCIEPKVPGLHWEQHRREGRMWLSKGWQGFRITLPKVGLFAGAAIGAVVWLGVVGANAKTGPLSNNEWLAVYALACSLAVVTLVIAVWKTRPVNDQSNPQFDCPYSEAWRPPDVRV